MCCQTHIKRVRTLYKSILRLHRGLPHDVQALGNEYVRDEFKRHKNLNEERIITTFMWEWTEYAINLAKQLGVKGIQEEKKIGKDLDIVKLNELKEEQIVQLHELYLAAKGNNNKKS